MYRLLPALSIACAFLIANTALAAGPGGNNVTGYWLTESQRAVVHIQPCEDSMCGTIYWIIEDGLQFDEHNDDEELRGRPMCGLKLMGDFEYDEDDNEWEDGFIYKADDGDMYDADMEALEDGTLKLRGYAGISMFGKTQIWTPVNPADYKQCKKPS